MANSIKKSSTYGAVLKRSRTKNPRLSKLTRISDTAIAKHLANGLLRGAVYSEGDFYCYTGMHWEAIPAHQLSKLVQHLDGTKYLHKDEEKTLAISAHKVDGVLKLLAHQLAKPDFFREHLPGINCESGFIVIDSGGNPTLEKHSAGHRQQHVLRGQWTPRAGVGELVRNCLRRNFTGDDDAEQKLDLLAEVAGVAALGLGGSKDGKAVIFVGESAGNGKSTILDLIKAGLPENARTALPPSKFSDTHHAVLLRGKLLNAVAELGTAGVIAGDAFKKMITGDEFAARGLYKDTITYRPRAQHVFACNAMPPFQGGIDPGVLRRLFILKFNRTIPEKERDGTIDRLPNEHADEFLAWIVDGASRYVRQGGFTVPESSRAELEEWSRRADPVLGWIADRISPVHATDDKCTSAEAHSDFELYCRAELRMRDRDIPRLKAFVDRCNAAFKGKGEIRHGHSGNFRGFFGMRLRDLSEPMKADEEYQMGLIEGAKLRVDLRRS
jgi:P4 family phage/plasmid primase-like protien